MQARRILYVANTAEGGSAVSLYHLVVGLDRQRYEPLVLFDAPSSHIVEDLLQAGITVLSPAQPFPAAGMATPPRTVKPRDIGKWLERRWGRGISQAYVCLKSLFDFARQDVSKLRSLIRMIRRHKIGLVHVNNGLHHNRAGIVAAWLARVPCVCHVRNFGTLNRFDKLLSIAVSSFIYISEAIAQDYMSQGIPRRKGQVIHNGVDVDAFAQQFDPEPVRHELNVKPHERLVGVVGRLDWWKGHDDFLEAVARVRCRIPSLRAVIIGAPQHSPQNRAYFQRLRRLTQSLQLEETVIFTGFRSDIPRLMLALDVLVLSSSSPEPFGRVVIEGMAAGKPVVATAAGGVHDIIEDGVNGLLVPCKDDQAMAQAIVWALSYEAQARKLGRTARQHVQARFTIERHVETVQGLYDRIFSETPSRSLAGTMPMPPSITRGRQL